jgi:hypothetical protein
VNVDRQIGLLLPSNVVARSDPNADGAEPRNTRVRGNR